MLELIFAWIARLCVSLILNDISASYPRVDPR